MNTYRADQSRPSAKKRRFSGLLSAIILSGMVAACGATITKHGHHFKESDLQQIQPGMSQDQVKLTLGSPTTTSSVGTGDAYYYFSNTTSQTAFLSPKEVDRQVVAVYFTRAGSVDRIAQYGMKDGKVFDFISRSTPPASTYEDGLFKQIFRNLGNTGPLFSE